MAKPAAPDSSAVPDLTAVDPRITTGTAYSWNTARPSSVLKQTHEAAIQAMRDRPYDKSERLVWKSAIAPNGLGPTGVDSLMNQVQRGDPWQSTQRDYSMPKFQPDVQAGPLTILPATDTIRQNHGQPTLGHGFRLQVSNSKARIFGQ